MALIIEDGTGKSDAESYISVSDADAYVAKWYGTLAAWDDLGAERVSDWSIQMLYLLIDRRYRDLKQTFISSNLSLSEIADKLDDRIASRIAEMCIRVKFQGEDRRAKPKEG